MTLEEKKKKSKRGFASWDPEKQRETARKGGIAVHERGSAHTFNPAEAREAGKKGGKTVSQDREHMRAIGRLGGKSRALALKETDEAPTVGVGVPTS
jgi:hypothetical protein